MININAIIQDAERYCATEKTELHMPTVASFLTELSKRYGGEIKRNECGSVARTLMSDADKNDPKALYELGLCYYLGLGVPYDYAEAARRFRSAAERKHAEGISALGVCYMEGRGVEYSPDKAIKMFKLGEKLKQALSLYNLGLCYYNGYGVEEDRKTGFHYIEEAAKLGLGEAYNKAGEFYERGDFGESGQSRAIKCYTEAANRGCGEGMHNLGLAYGSGLAGQPDLFKCSEYCRRAYEAGFVHTFYMLSQFYNSGSIPGVPQDQYRARAVRERAADLDEPNAICEIALETIMNSQHEDIPRYGVRLLMQAAHLGSGEAGCILGGLLSGGALGKDAQPLALRYYALASFFGNGDASLEFSKYYAKGLVVQQDAQKSLKLLMRASKQGNGDASLALGKMAQDGALNFPEDQRYKAAVFYFIQGAKSEHPGCLRELANCFKKGLGVERNEMEAKEYLRRAKELERQNGKRGKGFFGR
ncbi:MAG: sel1 repeat family protein [Thermoguttaceae bacterium]|nr:sel1 repeat family protein [Thermoguttaceae bacterium]